MAKCKGYKILLLVPEPTGPGADTIYTSAPSTSTIPSLAENYFSFSVIRWGGFGVKSILCCQTPVQVQQSSPSQSDKELTLFSPCHKNKNNKNKNNKNKNNPHQNPPEGSVLQTGNLEHRLNSQNKDLTHHPWDGHPPSNVWSPTIQRMITH